MKNTIKNKLVLILASTALGMGLVSCAQDGDGSSDDDNLSSVVAANRISHEEIPYTAEDDEVDLDDYIEIKYEDGTSNKVYDVTCSNKDVKIKDHKVLASKAGTYTLVVTAGSLTSKIDFNVTTEEHIELINYLEPLNDNPQNYEIILWTITKTYDLAYETSYIHNPNYVAVYDENDPSATYTDSKTGETLPDSIVFAKLNDNHGYLGNTKGTAKNPDVEFEPGYITYENYYLTGDLSLDASDFSEETFTVNGSTEHSTLLSSDTFEESLMSYGMSIVSSSLARYDYGYYGVSLEGFVDLDEDKIDETPLLGLWITYLNDSGKKQIGLYSYITLANIGESGRDFLDNAVTSDSYVPTKIEAPEIGTVFDAIAAGKNYTLTTELYSCDEEGNALEDNATIEPVESGEIKGYPNDVMYLYTGVTHIKVTSTFTNQGLIASCETNSVTEGESNWTVKDEMTLSGKYAIWDDGTDTYISNYDSEKSAMAAPTKTDAGKTVYDSGELDDLFIDAITLADINETIWTRKTTEGTKTTLQGQCGDSTKEETTNTLFKKLFDMNGFGLIGKSGEAVGSFLSESVEFSKGSYHALTMYSNYENFEVDSSTKEVNIYSLTYWPVGLDNAYVAMKITISNVGTTVNDFTTFNA